MVQVIAGIVSLLEAVPILDKWFEKIATERMRRKLAVFRKSKNIKEQTITALYNAIDRAETNEELQALSILVTDFNTGKLRHTDEL